MYNPSADFLEAMEPPETSTQGPNVGNTHATVADPPAGMGPALDHVVALLTGCAIACVATAKAHHPWGYHSGDATSYSGTDSHTGSDSTASTGAWGGNRRRNRAHVPDAARSFNGRWLGADLGALKDRSQIRYKSPDPIPEGSAGSAG